MAVTEAEVEASKLVWKKWRDEGRPYPLPPVPEYLTMDECASLYGTYDTPQGPVPILAPGVVITNFKCLCGKESGGYLEYDGYLVCSKDCGALLTDATKFDDTYRAEAAERKKHADEVAKLEKRIADLRAKLA